MTSGVFKTVPIDEVWVDRAKRQRKELPQIEELADSIRRSGLINPPVIRRSGELVAGERRWTACRSLGWTSIPVQYIEDLPEHEIRQVELEENIRRVDLPWPDRCKAVMEYHSLRAATDPEWNSTRTGEALGLGRLAIENHLTVAKELEKGNERVAAAPAFSTARNIVRRDAERKRSVELETIVETPKNEAPILNVDFKEWTRAYHGPKFNLIHCDFPYGVNADKHDQGAAKSHGGYADSEEIYWDLLATLGSAMRHVVDESAHLIFWFSLDFYKPTLDLLTQMGWHVDPFPLIWHKTDNTGILPDPNRGPRRIYETAFFGRRGDRKVVQAVSNCTGAPVTKEYHMSEKSLVMLRHFFRMVCDEHSTVLDPTCGSANSIVAARLAGAQRVLGLEQDAEFHERAVDNWRKHDEHG